MADIKHRISKRQRASERIQVYVTPYLLERARRKAKKMKLGGVSVLFRLALEDYLGLDKDHRAAMVKMSREEVQEEGPDPALQARVREIMGAQSLPEGAARRVAEAERRRA